MEDLKVIEPIKRCRLEYPTKSALFCSIYSEIVGNYYLSEKKICKFSKFNDFVYKEFLYEAHTGKNQIPIKPMTSDKNQPTSSCVYPDEDIRPICDAVFEEWLIRCVGEFEINRGVQGPNVVQPLSYLCVEALRFSNKIYNEEYVDGVFCRRVRWTTTQLHTKEYIKLYSEFNRDTTYRGPHFDTLLRLLPDVNDLVFRSLDCERFRKKLKFRYNPIELLSQVKLETSGGILPLASGNVNNPEFSVKNSGKKIFLIMAAIKEFDQYIRKILDGKDYQLNPIGVIRIKGEWRYFLKETGKKLVDCQSKAREFFIPSLLFLFLSLIFGERRKFETGRVIMIGMKSFMVGLMS